MLNACFTVELNDDNDILKIHCRSNIVKKFDHGRIICYCPLCPALKEIFTLITHIDFWKEKIDFISFVSSRACIFYM